MGKTLNQALNGCLFFTVKKLDRILDKVAEETFKPTGLSPTYGFILLAVDETPGIAQKDLAELLHTAPSTIARFVDKLEYKKLLITEKAGRNTLAYLTDEGAALVDKVQEAWDKLHQFYEDILGEEESDKISTHIHRLGNQLKSK